MSQVTKCVQVRDEGRQWREGYVSTDAVEVWKDLATDLMNKRLFHASYIRSITHRARYDGTVEITVTYDNTCRSIYTVPHH